MARDEALQAQEALASKRGGYGDRRGTEHKATAHVLGQGTEEAGAGRGPAASGTDPFGERQTPPRWPSFEIRTAPRGFFNTLGCYPKFVFGFLHRDGAASLGEGVYGWISTERPNVASTGAG